MLKFLQSATKAAGLTYQLLTTTVLIGSLGIAVVKHVRRERIKVG